MRRSVEHESKHSQLTVDADIIAGDYKYVRKYMPEDMTGKWVVTNTTTAEDVEFLRDRGVELLVTSTPRLEGRSFGTNVIEATMVALDGAGTRLSPERYWSSCARRASLRTWSGCRVSGDAPDSRHALCYVVLHVDRPQIRRLRHAGPVRSRADAVCGELACESFVHACCGRVDRAERIQRRVATVLARVFSAPSNGFTIARVIRSCSVPVSAPFSAASLASVSLRV